MILPSARDCSDVVSNISNTRNAYLALALGNIATAVASGAFNCTLTTSGKAGADVQAVRALLKQLGYRLTQATTTITIYWDGSADSEVTTY